MQRTNWMRLVTALVISGGLMVGMQAEAAPVCAPDEEKFNLTEGLDWLTNAELLDRTDPANLIANGDFSDVEAVSGSLDNNLVWAFGANAVAKEIDSFATWLTDGNYRNGVQLVTIPEWTVTGGGSKTYAFISTATDYDGEPELPDFAATEALMAGASPNLAYFGNSVFWGATPEMSFEIEGEVSRESYVIANSNFTAEELGDGDSPVKITQTVQTTPGKTYRLQFVQLTEGGTTVPLAPGAFGVEITGYGRSYLRVNEQGRRLTLDFLATEAETDISFLQYGHFSYDNGYSSELALDDVMLFEVEGNCFASASSSAVSVDATSPWSVWLLVLAVMAAGTVALVFRQ